MPFLSARLAALMEANASSPSLMQSARDGAGKPVLADAIRRRTKPGHRWRPHTQPTQLRNFRRSRNPRWGPPPLSCPRGPTTVWPSPQEPIADRSVRALSWVAGHVFRLARVVRRLTGTRLGLEGGCSGCGVGAESCFFRPARFQILQRRAEEGTDRAYSGGCRTSARKIDIHGPLVPMVKAGRVLFHIGFEEVGEACHAQRRARFIGRIIERQPKFRHRPFGS